MKRVTALCLVLGITVLTGCKSINLSMPTSAPKETTAMTAPLVEKRETITATGYAVVTIQNHKNPAQQRLMAIRASKLDAYRNLTEQVYGQQLDASSTVADMVVTNDTVAPLYADAVCTALAAHYPQVGRVVLGPDIRRGIVELDGQGEVVGGIVVDGGSFDWDGPKSAGKFAELTQPYDGFHNMVFTEESTVGAFLLRARREGLRDFGACMSPHTAWLILQGIETLPLRMAQHMRNTEKVVEFLATQPFVSRVGHPMLESHGSHALAQKLLPRGAGSVFSFDLKGNREQGKKFIETLKVFSHLANVGDCRSLVIHPASTTHFRMTDEALAAGGIGPGTIRLSIGLEDPADLIDDLKKALTATEKA